MTKKREIPAVSVALLKGDRILLVKRGRGPSRGMYAFPGGKVERGESHEKAARRELLEETGLVAMRLTSYREFLIESDREDVNFRLEVFSGSVETGEPYAGDDAEEAGWHTLANLERLPVVPSVLAVARELLTR
jgi:8-oxo-dGTP diphosphatase